MTMDMSWRDDAPKLFSDPRALITSAAPADPPPKKVDETDADVIRILEQWKETKFVLEATSAEYHLLWERFSSQSTFLPYNVVKWEQVPYGYNFKIGELNGQPIQVDCNWFRLEGFLIMRFEAISNVVDHQLVREWLQSRCKPLWDGGTRVAYTNADNFHHVLEYVRRPSRR